MRNWRSFFVRERLCKGSHLRGVVSAQTGTTESGFGYTASNSQITITGYFGTDGVVSIPSIILG